MGANTYCDAHCVETVRVRETEREREVGGEGAERGDREQISGGCQVSLGNLP